MHPFFPADTSLDSVRVYYRLLSAMTPAERLDRLDALERETEILAGEGVRRRHPEYNDRQVFLAISRMRLGPHLFQKAYPGVRIEP